MSVYYLGNTLVPSSDEPLKGSIHLSPRQIDVLTLLCDGLSNKPIGRNLGISACTVKQHVQAILKEFRVETRLQAVVFAYKNGILPTKKAVPARAGHGSSRVPLVSGI